MTSPVPSPAVNSVELASEIVGSNFNRLVGTAMTSSASLPTNASTNTTEILSSEAKNVEVEIIATKLHHIIRTQLKIYLGSKHYYTDVNYKQIK